MQNLIPMRAYVDAGQHERELAVLRGAWHYAALRRDLMTNRDWVLVKLADREVVIQNFEGHLSAFTNTCPHRFNAIRSGDCGNGPLICPYHRWSFGRDGTPTGIPFRDTFRDLDCEKLRLESWDVDTCGEFVFVRPRAENGIALSSWLGVLAPRLETIGAGLSKQYGRFRLNVQANWKLVVQNTLEFDHVYSVHPETFGAVVARRPKLAEIDMPPPHVGYRATLSPPEPTRSIHKRVAAVLERGTVGNLCEHEHISLFPLTAIGIYRRESIAILRYVPTSANQTIIDTRLFLPHIEDITDAESALLTAYSEIMVAFARKLGEEDRDICESVQRGVSNLTEHRGTFGDGERIVWAFQQAYCDHMGCNSQDSGLSAVSPRE